MNPLHFLSLFFTGTVIAIPSILRYIFPISSMFFNRRMSVIS